MENELKILWVNSSFYVFFTYFCSQRANLTYVQIQIIVGTFIANYLQKCILLEKFENTFNILSLAALLLPFSA